jgi:heme exporter protein D
MNDAYAVQIVGHLANINQSLQQIAQMLQQMAKMQARQSNS